MCDAAVTKPEPAVLNSVFAIALGLFRNGSISAQQLDELKAAAPSTNTRRASGSVTTDERGVQSGITRGNHPQTTAPPSKRNHRNRR